jgi:hypothetical protein
MVILTRRWAWKIPALFDSSNHWSWKSFCQGMLANMQEVLFSHTQWPELCPVKFDLPLGLLIVMPRVEVMTTEEFAEWDVDGFIEKEDYCVPSEKKHNSFGWLGDRIVCIDYGN